MLLVDWTIALTVVERPTIALVSPTVVQCPTQRGFEYQLQASTDLSTWKDSGTRQTGDGFVHRFTNSPSEARVTFYQIAVR